MLSIQDLVVAVLAPIAQGGCVQGAVKTIGKYGLSISQTIRCLSYPDR